ncbi:hypothetical protein ANO11243_048660 [Dothideomycetidae sp. 11243]|nr:hypothetical protein ANO11243_048660 [fungal sp. No.11243]
MPFSQSSRLSLLVVANLLIPLACLIFATGFFPYKPLLPGLATFKDQDANEELGLLPERMFSRVIFMVVDALRSDFVYSAKSGFEVTQGLIRNGAALPFTAYAAPPTVTMPRVKALTTGSVPSFVDLILNFAESDTSSSLVLQDTWLAQIKAHIHGEDAETRGELVFYGDDTWLKLFPNFFTRWDGTSSFFVSDFTEVDNNVTRHIDSMLRPRHWDGMIMHYLGLDHIGHKTGPDGPQMIPKQREMDTSVRMIWDAMVYQKHMKDTLLVVAGDHGMNSAGNHGGSAAGETSTAMLFISPKFQELSTNGTYLDSPISSKSGTEFDFYNKIQQSDLVPSLSALLGLPIPKNNLGIIVPRLLDMWKGSDEEDLLDPYLQLIYRNALQILDIVKSHYGPSGFVNVAGSSMSFNRCRLGYSGKAQLQCLWSRAQRMMLAASLDGRFSKSEQAEALLEFLKEAQEQLSATASSYDVTRLVLGILIASIAVIAAIFASSSAYVTSSATLGFSVLTALYSIMMFASSFVEEEQHIWYWMTGGWLAALAAARYAGCLCFDYIHLIGYRLIDTSVPKVIAACGAALLAVHRINDRWNQTGQKHAGESDISKFFFAEHYYVLWALLLGPDAPELVGNLFITIRRATAESPLVSQARMIFVALAILCFAVVISHATSKEQIPSSNGSRSRRMTLAGRLHPPLQLFLLTQTRVTNAPLFLLYSAQFAMLPVLFNSPVVPLDAVSRRKQSTITVTKISLTILLLSYASYFQTGGSNAISSIDLSNAYNGVASYNIAAVGALLFLGNWAGPVWWTAAGIVLLQMHQDQEAATHYALMTLFTATGLAATMLACTILRTHLFIWTVFSPKYLYAVAWAVGWHGIVSGVLGACLWWAD